MLIRKLLALFQQCISCGPWHQKGVCRFQTIWTASSRKQHSVDDAWFLSAISYGCINLFLLIWQVQAKTPPVHYNIQCEWYIQLQFENDKNICAGLSIIGQWYQAIFNPQVSRYYCYIRSTISISNIWGGNLSAHSICLTIESRTMYWINVERAKIVLQSSHYFGCEWINVTDGWLLYISVTI